MGVAGLTTASSAPAPISIGVPKRQGVRRAAPSTQLESGAHRLSRWHRKSRTLSSRRSRSLDGRLPGQGPDLHLSTFGASPAGKLRPRLARLAVPVSVQPYS